MESHDVQVPGFDLTYLREDDIVRSTPADGRIITRLAAVLAAIGLLAMLLPIPVAMAAPPGISLEQCRNGSATDPNDCPDGSGGSGWVSGNVGASQGHLLEGYSIPYRAVMTNLPPNTTIVLTLGYDIKHSDLNALDYLTYYDRLLPHGVFGHDPELINPVGDIAALSGATPDYFAIPAPSSIDSPVAGMPTDSFNSLPTDERRMTLWGGTISDMYYVQQGDLNASQSETTIAVEFQVTSATAVLAWGGHIARGDEWDGASASEISGSPYHMRLKTWNLNNLGNQDRSLSAGAVVNPPKLVVIKHVINDNGGTAVAGDFTMSVTGGSQPADPSSFPGEESPGKQVLFPDSVSGVDVGESGPPGYTATYVGDCFDVSISVEQTKTCTVTNDDDAPSLTLIKHVITDNGGTAVASDWTLSAGSNSVTGSETGALATDQAGTYALSETSVTGYTNTSITCDNSTGPVTSVTVGLGEDVTCTFVNDDDAPSLTLIKHVITDNGGTAVASDWTLSAGSNSVTGSETGALATDQAGTYALSETSVTGYTNTSITCDNSTGPVTSVTVGLGEDVTCTFVNDDDAPSLTLIKHVDNTAGGSNVASDWTLTALGPTGFSGAGPSVSSSDTFDAGTYDLSESGPTSPTAVYTASDWVCVGGDQTDADTVTLGLGDSATCTITNTAQKAQPSAVTSQGWTLHDTASFSDVRHGASSESGVTVTFELFDDAECTNSVGTEGPISIWDADAEKTLDEVSTVTGIQVYPGKDIATTYYWIVSRTGDEYNLPYTSVCGSEKTTITPVQNGPDLVAPAASQAV